MQRSILAEVQQALVEVGPQPAQQTHPTDCPLQPGEEESKQSLLSQLITNHSSHLTLQYQHATETLGTAYKRFSIQSRNLVLKVYLAGLYFDALISIILLFEYLLSMMILLSY